MYISIYLLHKDRKVKQLMDYVDNESIDNTEERFDEIKPKDRDLQKSSLLMVQVDVKRKLSWVKLFSDSYEYDWEELFNQRNSAIYILRHKRNVFAISFGRGYSALKHRYVERRFGIKTVLNSIIPNKLKILGNRDLSKIKKISTTHIPNGSSLEEFDINQMTTWTRMVSGGSINQTLFGRTLLGTERLFCKFSGSLSGLPAFLDKVMERYKSTDYKAEFSYLDYIIPIGNDEPVIDKLRESLLNALIKNPPDLTALYLSYPESAATQGSKIDHFHIVWDGQNRATKYEGVEMNDILAACKDAKAYDIDFDFEKIHVTGRDSEGKLCTPTYSILDFVAFEVIQNRENYAFFDGSWVKIEKNFIKKVSDAILKIPNWSRKINLPDAIVGESEGDYNIRAAHLIKGACMDKKLYRKRVEACDIYHTTHGLIHIKKANSSAMLSHLFSQASVSAVLLRQEQIYLDWFRDSVKAVSGSKPQPANLSNAKFVIGMISDKSDLAKDLFLFSKITLLHHYQLIVNRNYKCGICVIKT